MRKLSWAILGGFAIASSWQVAVSFSYLGQSLAALVPGGIGLASLFMWGYLASKHPVR